MFSSWENLVPPSEHNGEASPPHPKPCGVHPWSCEGVGGTLFASCDKTETRERVEMGDSPVGASVGSWVLMQQSSSHREGERERLTPTTLGDFTLRSAGCGWTCHTTDTFARFSLHKREF